MNGLRKCCIYTQWNFTKPQRRMKFCHLQVNGWNWRASFEVKLGTESQKITCSPSYADYRPKTTAAVLGYMGHTKGRPYTGGIGQRKETKNLNVVDVFTVQK
jgi:hypothetical protein